MSRRDTLFGLPRYVLAILRHMEAHSERLKWSLAEESNQLTLTLTWNFDSAKPRKTKETLWKKLQRSLGLERHPTTSPLSHSSQPDLQQTPITRRFLLETSADLPVTASRSTFDGWRSRDSQLTVTSRCRSLPGRMHDSGGGGASVDGWERTSMNQRQTRASRRTDRVDVASVPLRARRTHHHQQHGGVYTRHTSSPTYITPSAHLTLPAHRSRGTAKSYVTSQDAGAPPRASQRHVSPSHFSWPGTSFDLQAGLPDDEEGRSSAGTTQGAAEPTSPSLPSSTSTATNACTRPPPLSAPDDDVTPSNGDADTEVADVTAAGRNTDNGDVTATEAESSGRRRRRSCEFNLLDDDDSWSADRRDDDVTGPEWAWSTTRPDWADVICVNDDNQVTATSTTTAAAATDDDDDDDEAGRDDGVAQTTAINETVMKCIESCDKVLLRHSTAIR